MKTTPKDHQAKKPTKAQIVEAQTAAELEQKNQAEFIEKYNALVAFYGFTIVPQIGVQLQKVNK